MPFCKECGKEISEGSKFCQSCGQSIDQNQDNPTNEENTRVMTTPPSKKDRKYKVAIWLVPLLLIIFFSCCCCSSLYVLSVMGAKGQPATVIPPSSQGGTSSVTGEKTKSGTSVPIPDNLKASTTSQDIRLNWDDVSINDLKEYRVYKSVIPGDKFVLASRIDPDKSNYIDKNIQKGVTYYYVVTAATTDKAESGNSNQASAVVEAPPLVPKGIYSWEDVKKKCEADSKYLKLLNDVTGLTKSDVDRLAKKEKGGMKLKKTLKKGTIITNSTKNYKILPGYVLKRNRIALTDENGVPHVLAKCGNPMDLQVPVTTTSVIIQNTQIFINNVIVILPPSVINIFINICQPINDVVISIMPESIEVLVGPTMAPPPPDIFIDPAFVGLEEDYHEDEDVPEDEITPDHDDSEIIEDEPLEEGQKWIEEGKLLVEANPPDPSPKQSVTIIVRLIPAQAGVDIKYEVSGTDDYNSSGTKKTNAEGEISFSIPGGATGVKDNIKVDVPSLGLQGSVDYEF